MRSHGVPSFPDPQNGHFLIQGSVENSPQFASASETCQKYLPNGLSNGGSGTSGGSSTSTAELKFAECMRSHGVTNFPDPTGGALAVPQGVNTSSPQFQAAQQACQSLLPGGTAP
jgi:hypothetical protein